jgi:tRNA 2-(methylsulfanyl)-N6-isopentenyladenosine37 hydroxylase
MLGLGAPTDDAWVTAALANLNAVLVDHAHCEMKAAANALSLIARYSMRPPVARALADIAREESDHFERVLVLLGRRGLALGAPPVDSYAAELRRIAAAHRRKGASHIVDRLLVGALIEARSCERFKLLVAGLAASPSSSSEHTELRDFYAELLAAEARHCRLFVDLACESAEQDSGEAGVLSRLAWLRGIEADIVVRLARGNSRARIHG